MVDRVVDHIERAAARRRAPLLVALDGRSGAGKSTLATAVARRLEECAVIDGDDFYAGGSAAWWDAMSPAAKAAWAIDWRRQRTALAELGSGRGATWHAFDWTAFDGRLEAKPTQCAPAPVVLLEGAYSGRPELADLLDLRVLVEVSAAVRHERLVQREGPDHRDAWFARWDAAEGYYFTKVMPSAAFDLVVRP